jgi:hypothetical protein
MERNALLDYALLLAALGLVWFDTQAPGNRIAYLSVPFLLIILTLPTNTSLAAKAQRLLVPFLVWSLVFAIIQIAFALKAHAPPLHWWQGHMLLTGTWGHLWILPFAFLAAVLAPWFQHPLASLGTALLVAALLSLEGTPAAPPFGLWSFGIIPILVAVAYVSWGWRLAAVTLALSFTVLHFGRPSPDNVTILVGTALALVAMSVRIPTSPTSEWCARLGMWVFLAHPVVVIIGQSLRITWVELALFSVAGSLILAMLVDSALQGQRRGRWELS